MQQEVLRAQETRQNAQEEVLEAQKKEISQLQDANAKLQQVVGQQKKVGGYSNEIQKVLNLQAAHKRDNDARLDKTYRLLMSEIVDEAARRERIIALRNPSALDE